MSEVIFCPVRKERVAAFPEERVRQRVLRLMFEELGFPSTLVAVEKSLRQLPHISSAEAHLIPNRRADIICFAKGIHPEWELYPLLIVECKAIKLTPKAVGQISGYNHYVRAYFIAIANGQEIRVGWQDSSRRDYTFIPHLPSYIDLTNSVAKNIQKYESQRHLSNI